MKTFFTKFKVIIWLTVFILLINVTILATMFFYNYKKSTSAPYHFHPHNTQMHDGSYMQKRLNLSGHQFEKFTSARMSFQKNAWDIKNQLRDLRIDFLSELKETEPDTIKIQKISEEIGRLHTELKIETSRYYLNLKHICNIDQQNELNDIFMMMMDGEDTGICNNQVNRCEHNN